jgi:hypothetical protein
VQLGVDGPTYPRTSTMTRLQARAFELLGLKEAKTVAVLPKSP